MVVKSLEISACVVNNNLQVKLSVILKLDKIQNTKMILEIQKFLHFWSKSTKSSFCYSAINGTTHHDICLVRFACSVHKSVT